MYAASAVPKGYRQTLGKECAEGEANYRKQLGSVKRIVHQLWPRHQQMTQDLGLATSLQLAEQAVGQLSGQDYHNFVVLLLRNPKEVLSLGSDSNAIAQISDLDGGGIAFPAYGVGFVFVEQS